MTKNFLKKEFDKLLIALDDVADQHDPSTFKQLRARASDLAAAIEDLPLSTAEQELSSTPAIRRPRAMTGNLTGKALLTPSST